MESWPVASQKPSSPGAGPMMNRPSRLRGRSPARPARGAPARAPARCRPRTGRAGSRPPRCCHGRSRRTHWCCRHRTGLESPGARLLQVALLLQLSFEIVRSLETVLLERICPAWEMTARTVAAAARSRGAGPCAAPTIRAAAGVEVGAPRKGQLLVSEPLPPLVRAVISHAGHIPFKEHGLQTPHDFEGELQKKRYLKQTRSGGFQGRFLCRQHQ